MTNKAVILGGGESGVGAALLAKSKGFEVFLSDFSPIKENYKAELIENNISFEEGNHDFERILSADLVIKSPGISSKIELVKQINQKRIPLVSEIEFAFKFCYGKIIAITGSNGKTTTTNLVYHLLKNGGLNVAVGGNIGNSFAKLLLEKPYDYYVLELSSFQLDEIYTFHPYISILLNITPDHLDRYEYDINKYALAKFNINKYQTENEVFILNQDDPISQDTLKNVKTNGEIFFVNKDHYTEKTVQIEDQKFDLSQSRLKGPHNLFNATCAIKAALLLGVEKEKIQEGLISFVNAPHRLELVATIDGIDFINDSKATNVDAVFFGLSAMEKPTILILGGIDKGNDYSVLDNLVKDKVKAIVCLGKDNSPITKHFKGKLETVIETDNINDAISISKDLAEKGDAVLLSPACASFDLFKNYEDRGNQFKSIVLSLH